ncbi:MAG: phosphoribosyl-ATP diphosphatase, partial [Alkalispirochaeta sp.]
YDGLVIRGLHNAGDAGEIADVVLCSEKSRTKSVEQGELWIVDPDTRRVLPWRGGGIHFVGRFRRVSGWYEVEVDVSSETIQEGSTLPGTGDESVPPTVIADPPTPTADSLTAGSVLAELAATIANRRRTMPEGSYTTHLFTKGPDKIRKKTGEEAVELILARSNEELLSEAADLIYHLMVLLEAEGLSITDVISVLHRRHQAG